MTGLYKAVHSTRLFVTFVTSLACIVDYLEVIAT